MQGYSSLYKALNELLKNHEIKKIFHSVKIREEENGDRFPIYPIGDEYGYCGAADNRGLVVYCRQIDDMRVIKTESLGSGTNSYRVAIPHRVVFFQDHMNAIAQDIALNKYLKLAYLSNIQLVRVIKDNTKVQEIEGMPKNFKYGAETFHAAIDFDVIAVLTHNECENATASTMPPTNPFCSPVAIIEENTNSGSVPGGGGSGNTNNIPTIQSSAGVDEGGAGEFWKFNFSNVLNTLISIFIDHSAVIDWGNGICKRYQPNSTIQNQYSNAGNVQIKVYWGSNVLNHVTECWQQSGVADNTAKLDSVDGTFPANLWRFQVSNGLETLPLDLLPATVKYWGLRRCSLTTAKQDELYAKLVENNLSKGYVNTSQQTPPAVPTPIATQDDNEAKLFLREWYVYHD